MKTLCNTLNWGNWNSEFVKLDVRWAERDIDVENFLVLKDMENKNMNSKIT